MVATLIRATGDWTVAEDAAQEAFARAAASWPADGVPDAPGAWLLTVARRAAVDALRRHAAQRRRADAQGIADTLAGRHVSGDPADQATLGWEERVDDRLRLIFTCAHPALALEARVALTLRIVGGLQTDEIARAFLVSTPTMAQRIVRAKRRIAGAGVPYRVPDESELPHRLHGVLSVLYVIFSEGYSSAGGQPLRDDLAGEAIRLARMLVELVPVEQRDDPRALLALMLLQHSRRRARVVGGAVVPFDEQDRSLWNRGDIDEAAALLRVPVVRRTSYRVQAEIAGVHALSASPAQTPWRQVVELYDELGGFVDSPVVALNRAIAVSFADSPERGLIALDDTVASGHLAGGHLVPATRADMLRRAGRLSEAADLYALAASRAPSDPERRFLERRRLDALHRAGRFDPRRE
ncbi:MULTISPECIES: RNA polymerase sigma factor [unclassified Microbacterium]|uniref:RNA polymerase sigma factor n=1 Tax=unclassified Microbacterium TaxID=2609290 RepID=UPI002002B3FF|nr:MULTISPECIES: DUF6596 domain-containing protein [unclassified Microbacterium]